jgi:thiamine-phosphate pyrophosphorylase
VKPLPCRLLVVTERKLSARPVLDTVEAAMQGGAAWFWLRDRDLSEGDREQLAKTLMRAVQGQAVLTIGADVQLALRVGAHGVHLPASADVGAARACLGPKAFIGVSAHCERDVHAAMSAGADYATLSPVFPSASKPGYGPALGVDAIARAGACGLPILALGGVTKANVAGCLDAGASGVAVMGGISGAPDPRAKTAALLKAIAGSEALTPPEPEHASSVCSESPSPFLLDAPEGCSANATSQTQHGNDAQTHRRKAPEQVRPFPQCSNGID